MAKTRKRKSTKGRRKGRKKSAAKRSNRIPLPILKKRLARLTRIVDSRS